MNYTKIFTKTIVILAIMIVFDTALAGITNSEIKAASKSWVSTIQDWTPGLTFGGFVMAAIMFFVNKYTYAIGALGGTAFLYAAKAFKVRKNYRKTTCNIVFSPILHGIFVWMQCLARRF